MVLVKPDHCKACGNPNLLYEHPYWHCKCGWKYDNTPIGKRVFVHKPNSPWHGTLGTIEEITSNPQCPVRVKFVINKQVYGELFHPTFLTEVDDEEKLISEERD